MSGFISFVFTILLTASSGLAFVYWQVGKRKPAKIWTLISILFAGTAVIAGAIYYLAPNPPVQPVIQTTIAAPEKPHLFVKEARMEPLTEGKAPVVLLEVQNGPIESTFVFKNETFVFTRFVPEKYLHYNKDSPSQRLKAAPRQALLSRWTRPDLILTQEQIEELNAAKPLAELYVFAQGEYTDEIGTHSIINTCWQYDKDFPTHLVYCRDDIKID